MTSEAWEALGVQTQVLPQDFIVPMAAAGAEAIESYVGAIRMRIPGRTRSTNMLEVEAHRPVRSSLVPLWVRPEADQHYSRLHPPRQLWVHVDYRAYRRAWKRLGFGELTGDTVLDHVRNRAAERLCGYRHPFLRLCPVSWATNTSGGLDNGAEGLEKLELRKRKQQPAVNRERVERHLAAPVVLADPIDLTKMLDIPPGLSELPGVASMLHQFYARTG